MQVVQNSKLHSTHSPHDKLAIGVWPHASCTVVGLSRHSFLVCGGVRDAMDRNTLLRSVEVVRVQ